MVIISIKKNDLKIILKQLNINKIENINEITVKCSFGFPQLIKSYPLKNNKPFPTLYWLTCPYLCRISGDLESKNYIDFFQNLVNNDKDFKKQYISAHENDIEERLNLINEDINNLTENMKNKLIKTGIGGIKNYETIKCLHLHIASYLGSNINPIGKYIIDNLIDDIECKTNYCSKL